MIPKLHVGAQGPFPRGALVRQSAGLAGEALTSQLQMDHYELALSGNLFKLSTVPAGVAIPISTTTSPNMVLWNPSGSGINAVLMEYIMNYVSGTATVGAVVLMFSTNAGENVAAGSVFSAFAQVNPTNAFIGVGNVSQMKTSSSATNTLTNAGTLYQVLGTSIAAGANPSPNTIHRFDGSTIVPPGCAVWIAATAASVALFAQTLVWEEVAAVVAV